MNNEFSRDLIIALSGVITKHLPIFEQKGIKGDEITCRIIEAVVNVMAHCADCSDSLATHEDKFAYCVEKLISVGQFLQGEIKDPESYNTIPIDISTKSVEGLH